MADFLEQALRDNPNRVHVLKPTLVKYSSNVQMKGEDGQITHVHQEASNVEILSDALSMISATTAVPTALLSGGIIEFRLSAKGLLPRLDMMFLKIFLTNTSGVNQTIVPSQLCLQYWQVFGQNGNDLILQENGIEMWLSNIYYDQLTWQNIAALLGSNANFSTAGTTVANGNNLVLYIPLLSFFEAARIYLAGLQSEVLLRFTFNPRQLNFTTAGALDCTNCVLLLKGSYEPKSVDEYKMKIYRLDNVDFPFLNVQRTSYTMTLAAATQYQIILSGIAGLVAGLFVVVRASPVLAANIGTIVNAIATIDIQNQSGNSIIGYYSRDRNDNDMVYWQHFPNLFQTNSRFILINWNDCPLTAFHHGSSCGFRSFSGFERAVFTTDAGLAPGSYQIDIFARVYSTAVIRNNQLKVLMN